jgi:hypothetical protein
MDGSFLSDDNVVAASRKFVCIRLATYEDKRETEFLKTIFVGRSGALENTVFAILSPDGKKPLVQAGRGPFFAYRDAAEMARGMNKIAQAYPAADKPYVGEQIPAMKSVELALNVAACDRLLALIVVRDESSDESEAKLAAIAWNTALAGQFVYGRAALAHELKPISGVTIKRGALLVEPGPFGLSGQVIDEYDWTTPNEMIVQRLQRALQAHSIQTPNYRQHIQQGVQMGIDWKTEVPVTDAQSIQAKKQYRGDQQ